MLVKKQAKKDRVLKDKEVGGLWAAISSGDTFLPYYTNLLRITTLFGCRTRGGQIVRVGRMGYGGMGVDSTKSA